MDLDVVLTAEVHQLFPDFQHELHVSVVDVVVLAEILFVFGGLESPVNFEQSYVIPLARHEGFPCHRSFLPLGCESPGQANSIQLEFFIAEKY